jgi:hypothetical protein
MEPIEELGEADRSGMACLGCRPRACSLAPRSREATPGACSDRPVVADGEAHPIAGRRKRRAARGREEQGGQIGRGNLLNWLHLGGRRLRVCGWASPMSAGLGLLGSQRSIPLIIVIGAEARGSIFHCDRCDVAAPRLVFLVYHRADVLLQYAQHIAVDSRRRDVILELEACNKQLRRRVVFGLD